MFAISKLYHSYKNIFSNKNDVKNDVKKFKKSNSIANINYIDNENIFSNKNDVKKFKKSNSIADIKYIDNKDISFKSASFIMMDTDSITQPNFILIDEIFSICNVCNSKFPKNCNTVCSYKCYKLSKKNIEGFSIKCKNCGCSFITKNLFTDYCSDECFNNIIKPLKIRNST